MDNSQTTVNINLIIAHIMHEILNVVKFEQKQNSASRTADSRKAERKKAMKLGEMREATNNVEVWGGNIEKVWLTKWMPTKHYQLLGLVRLPNGNANGWCILLDSENLKACREAARQY